MQAIFPNEQNSSFKSQECIWQIIVITYHLLDCDMHHSARTLSYELRVKLTRIQALGIFVFI